MDNFLTGFIAGMIFIWLLYAGLRLCTQSFMKDLKKTMEQEKEDVG